MKNTRRKLDILMAAFLFFLSLAPAQAMVDEILEEGSYIIRNRAFASTGTLPALGALSWSAEKSPSGYFSQILALSEGSCYRGDRDKYIPGGTYRASILWDLERVDP